MNRSGFSMIELVFVIVILGVLAAVAVPRFSTTRVDAQVATLRSDIASTLKAVPARVFAENIEISTSGFNQVKDPSNKTYSGWGEFILDTAGLDRSRWLANGSGVNPIAGKNGSNNVTCSVTGTSIGLIAINTNNAQLTFNPNKMATTSGPGKALCDALKNSYPTNSDRVIPLASTGSVKF